MWRPERGVFIRGLCAEVVRLNFYCGLIWCEEPRWLMLITGGETGLQELGAFLLLNSVAPKGGRNAIRDCQPAKGVS